MAYSFTSDKLFIGDNTATSVSEIIGGKYFTDKLSHTPGTLEASSAILVDSSKKIDVLNVDDITLDANIISTTNANGHLILKPNGNGQVQVQALTLAVVGDLTVSGTTVTTGGSTLGNLNITGNTISAINPTNGDITLTPKGTGDVILSGTQSLMLPKGGNIAALPADTGKIRYNTLDNRFEGVVSGSWTGLGGVVDLDQDTKITVESNGNDDDTIRFFVGQSNVPTEKGNINSTGLNINVINEFTANAGILLSDNVNIGTVSSPANLILSGNLTVAGTTTTIESVTTTVTDPVMELASDSGTEAAVTDRGVNFKYGDGTAIQTGFFGMDMATKRFSFQKVLGTGDTAADDNKFNAPWGDAQFNSLFLSGDIFTGSSNVSGNSIITGLSTIGSTLNVTGATTLAATLGVTGITTLSALLNADGGINCNSGKFVVANTSGNVSTAGTLIVTGATTLKSTLKSEGAVDFDTTLNVDGNTTLGGALTVASTVGITGAVTLTAGISVATTLGVTGITTLTGLLQAKGGINCDSGKFIVADTSGNVSTAGTLNVAGSTTLASTLSVTGAAALASTLIVTGATTLKSTLKSEGAVDFDTTLNVDGAVTHKSTTHLGSSAQMKITAAGVMTHGTIEGVGVIIDCGTF